MTRQEQESIAISESPAIERDKINTFYVVAISFIAAIGGFLFGYDLSVVSGASIFLIKFFGLTPASEGFVMSSAIVGCLPGALVAGYLSNRFGRKFVLGIAAIIFAVAAIGTAFPRTTFEFNAYRILAGFGIGLASVVSPMYIAEVAPARIRGSLVNLNQLSIVIGALCSSLVARQLAPSGNWRMMFALAAIPAVLLFICLIFVPQSPRWLVLKNRLQEANDILTRIGGANSAMREMAAIKEALAAKTGNFLELFSPGIRMALLIGAGLCFFQGWSGATAINFYLPTILLKAGFTDPQAAITGYFLMNVVSLFCCILCILFVDRLGRRVFLIWGTAGMALFLILTGYFFKANLMGKYVVASIYLYNVTYQVSLAPMAWLVLSEIFPTRVRAHGQTFATIIVWISTLITTFGFAPARAAFENRFGSPAGIFWIFAAVCVVSCLFTLILVPETKGRTLEEIGQLWTNKSDRA